jgi:hypothetical protein
MTRRARNLHWARTLVHTYRLGATVSQSVLAADMADSLVTRFHRPAVRRPAPRAGASPLSRPRSFFMRPASRTPDTAPLPVNQLRLVPPRSTQGVVVATGDLAAMLSAAAIFAVPRSAVT